MFDGSVARAEKSPKDIVAAVRRPVLFAAADKEAREFHARGVEIENEIRRLNGTRDDRNRSATDARIIELDAQRHDIAQQYSQALARVALHRPSFTAKIDAALAPYRLDAAQRAINAMAGLESALGELLGANKAAAGAGVDPQVSIRLPDLHRLRIALRRQVELAGGAN